MTDKPEAGTIKFYDTPLPHEWRGLYESYKREAKEYHAALLAIREVLKETDERSHDLVKIEDIVDMVFE